MVTTTACTQAFIVDMFRKVKIWAIREPQNMFHGLVPAEILKEYCDQHSMKGFIIPDIMIYGHPHRERSGRVILQRRIFEVKTMRVDSRTNKYNPRNTIEEPWRRELLTIRNELKS